MSLGLGLALEILTIEPEFQIRLNDLLALDIMPSYAYYYGDWVEADIMGGGLTAGLRISPFRSGLEKFYLVPRVSFLYLKGESDTDELSVALLTPSIEAGYAWIWGHFIMNAGGGLGWNFIVGGDDIYSDRTNFALLLNFSIGFAL